MGSESKITDPTRNSDRDIRSSSVPNMRSITEGNWNEQTGWVDEVRASPRTPSCPSPIRELCEIHISCGAPDSQYSPQLQTLAIFATSFAMQFSNVFLATAFLFFATSMAARAQSCNPNFEGKAVLISNGASGTVSTPGSGGSNAWYIQQNGQSPPRYILRNANDSNQALTRGENGYLKMAPASDSGNDLDQLFDIVCDTCTPGGPSFAEACMIKDPENRFVCVSASRSSPQELRTLPCNPGAPFQMYAFFPY